MKTSLFSSAIAGLAICLFSAFTLGMQTIKVQTSAVCGMCKDRIEGTLSQLDGVEDVRLDLVTKKVKVRFDDSKQSEQSIKLFISKIGYAADDLPADVEAFDALPGCCKSEAACAANKAAKEAAVSTDNEAAASSKKKGCCKGDKNKKACKKG